MSDIQLNCHFCNKNVKIKVDQGDKVQLKCYCTETCAVTYDYMVNEAFGSKDPVLYAISIGHVINDSYYTVQLCPLTNKTNVFCLSPEGVEHTFQFNELLTITPDNIDKKLRTYLILS